MPLLLLLVGPILFFFFPSFFLYLKVFFFTLVCLQVAFYFPFCHLRSFPVSQKKETVQLILSRDFLLSAYYCSVCVCVCLSVCLCKCLCVQFFFSLFFSSMPFYKDFSYLDYLKSLLHPTGRERHTLLLDLIKTQYISVFQDKGTGVLPLTNSGAPPLQKSYKLE